MMDDFDAFTAVTFRFFVRFLNMCKLRTRFYLIRWAGFLLG